MDLARPAASAGAGDKVGEEAFAVIREAMVATGTAAVSRLVLYRREPAVALVPRGRGIVLWTLRYGDEVRPSDDYFPEGGEGGGEADPARDRADRRPNRSLERALRRGHRPGGNEKIVAGKKPRRGKATEPQSAAPTSDNVVSSRSWTR